MVFSKILTVLGSMLLAVCLTLSITTLVVLRNAVSENQVLQEDVRDCISELDGYVEDLKETTEKDSVSTSTNIDNTQTKQDGFCIRAEGKKIGVYTTDGYLVRILDVSLDTLPSADRELLTTGISVTSWNEALDVIQDYEG